MRVIGEGRSSYNPLTAAQPWVPTYYDAKRDTGSESSCRRNSLPCRLVASTSPRSLKIAPVVVPSRQNIKVNKTITTAPTHSPSWKISPQNTSSTTRRHSLQIHPPPPPPPLLPPSSRTSLLSRYNPSPRASAKTVEAGTTKSPTCISRFENRTTPSPKQSFQVEPTWKKQAPWAKKSDIPNSPTCISRFEKKTTVVVSPKLPKKTQIVQRCKPRPISILRKRNSCPASERTTTKTTATKDGNRLTRTSFSDKDEIFIIPKFCPKDFELLFYDPEELAEFKHDAFIEEAGQQDSFHDQ